MDIELTTVNVALNYDADSLLNVSKKCYYMIIDLIKLLSTALTQISSSLCCLSASDFAECHCDNKYVRNLFNHWASDCGIICYMEVGLSLMCHQKPQPVRQTSFTQPLQRLLNSCFYTRKKYQSYICRSFNNSILTRIVTSYTILLLNLCLMCI